MAVVSKKRAGDYVFYAILTLFMIILIVVTVYPFLNALALSLDNAKDTVRGGITIYPRKFTMENYKRILTNPRYTGPTASPSPGP